MILIFVVCACAPKCYVTLVYQKVCHAHFICLNFYNLFTKALRALFRPASLII